MSGHYIALSLWHPGERDTASVCVWHLSCPRQNCLQLRRHRHYNLSGSSSTTEPHQGTTVRRSDTVRRIADAVRLPVVTETADL